MASLCRPAGPIVVTLARVFQETFSPNRSHQCPDVLVYRALPRKPCTAIFQDMFSPSRSHQSPDVIVYRFLHRKPQVLAVCKEVGLGRQTCDLIVQTGSAEFTSGPLSRAPERRCVDDAVLLTQ